MNDPAQTPDTRTTANGNTSDDTARKPPARFSPGRVVSGIFSGLLTRCVLIGGITLMLLIPLGMVKGVVYDRMHLQRSATENITSSWGGAQTVKGPLLVIPYQVWKDRKEMVKVMVNKKPQEKEVVTREYFTRHKVVLPSELTFDARVDPQVRYRGIYRQALYEAPVDIRGTFTLPTARDFSSNTSKIYWDQSWLSVGITDLKTISEVRSATWGNTPLPAYKPGADAGGLLGAGFHTAVALSEKDAGARRDMAIHLSIRGSGGISFTPVGETTTITMGGTWPDPSFQGNLLPKERKIGKDGFSAKWVISNLTRTYPQIADIDSKAFKAGRRDHYGSDGTSAITAFTAGVDLHEQVSLYRMVRRSLDYAILFIAVSFVALFSFELINRQRMHLVQYAMVGLSMSLFYLVLLSLAEHVSFGRAFTAASAVTVAMNSLYVGSVLRSKAKGCIMAVLLAGLYAVLFSLLSMEDFALLMGTGLVVAMMGVLMFVTRKLPQTPAAQG